VAASNSNSGVAVGTVEKQANISKEVRQAVQAEMQATVLPLLKQIMEESMAKTVTNPIQSSITNLGNQGITVDDGKIAGELADSLQEPLRAAFADCMKTVLIPSLESITGQVLAQVSDRLEKGSTANNSKTEKTIEAMSTQLSSLTALVSKLTSEVHSLRTSVASQHTKPSEPPAPQAPPGANAEDIRGEVLALLKKQQYEAAFTRAVAASTADMAVFCCTNADLNDVLGGTAPKLSQPILLCLMQQLGTVLGTSDVINLQTELEWLQEIALSLNPADASIQKHVPTVLQQLVASINARLNQGDQTLRRSLQRLVQVIRGMQMG
jgi:enhancer of mRNA-decapping protein 4